MVWVNQVKQTPLLDSYTRGKFDQLHDSIGVHRGRLINLINPAAANHLWAIVACRAFPLGPSPCRAAAGYSDRKERRSAEIFNHVRRQDGFSRN